MIFVDSNVPMYLVGADHPHKTDARVLLERLVANGERLVTDAEVLQEIIHRYAATNRRNLLAVAIQTTLDLVDEIFPVDGLTVMRAAEIVQADHSFSVRDSLHIAVMEQHAISLIFSFDADFDRWPGLQRIYRV